MNDIVKKHLKQLISQYGIELCNDHKRLRALLKDFCGEYQREINILTLAVQEGIVKKLIEFNSNELDNWQLSKLVRKFYDTTGIAENFAKSAVITWAEVLGKKVYSEGSEAVEINEEREFIDKNDNFVVNLQSDKANDFSECLAAVKTIYRKLGFINKNGDFVIVP